MTHSSRQQTGCDRQLGRWLLLRVICSLAISILMLTLTSGESHSGIFGTLAWTLFVVHLLATLAFDRRHPLDTVSFFPLILASLWASGLSRQGRSGDPEGLIIVLIPFAVAVLLSLVGRFRAMEQSAVQSVSLIQILVAVSLLSIAIAVCGGDKALVGFLFVPGFLLLPVIIFWALRVNSNAVSPQSCDTSESD